MVETNELLYETPKMSTIRKSLANLLFFIFFIPLNFVGIWMILSPFYFDMPWNAFVVGIMVISSSLVISIMVFKVFTYPNFGIYSQGISPIISPNFPFSKISYNSNLFRWSDIKCFDRYGYSEKNPRVILYLLIEINPRKRVIYSHPNSEVIARLISEMKKHGVKEIPSKCSQCGNETYGYLTCPSCNFNRGS